MRTANMFRRRDVDLVTGIRGALKDAYERPNFFGIDLMRAQVVVAGIIEEHNLESKEFKQQIEYRGARYAGGRWERSEGEIHNVRAMLLALFHPRLGVITFPYMFVPLPARFEDITFPRNRANSCFCDSILVAMLIATNYYDTSISRALSKVPAILPDAQSIAEQTDPCPEGDEVPRKMRDLAAKMRSGNNTVQAQMEVSELVHSIRSDVGSCALRGQGNTPESRRAYEYGQQDAFDFFRTVADVCSAYYERTPLVDTTTKMTFTAPGYANLTSREVSFRQIDNLDYLSIPDPSDRSPANLQILFDDIFRKTVSGLNDYTNVEEDPRVETILRNIVKQENNTTSLPPRWSANVNTQSRLVAAPRVLCVGVSVISFDRRLGELVEIQRPLRIELSGVVLPTIWGTRVKYIPFAFVEHAGGKDSGHYTLFFRYGTQWWHYNDMTHAPKPLQVTVAFVDTPSIGSRINCIWLERV